MLETMTLDQLRAFLAVCDAGSFSGAARRLQRAQSAVSHAVISLESALGVMLFDRSGRLPQLTPAGRTLAADARAVVARAEEMRARARSIAGETEPELCLAVDAFFPRDALIAALRALRTAFPLLPFTLYTEALGAVEGRVMDDQCSLGVSMVWPRRADVLDRRFLTHIEMIAVVAPGHELASAPRLIPTATLQRHTQLVLTDRSTLTEGLSGGILSSHIWRLADLQTKHDLLRAGFGWGNMPLHLVADDLAAGRLVRICPSEWGEAPLLMAIAAVHRRGCVPGPAASWFLDRLLEELARLCPSRLRLSALPDPAAHPEAPAAAEADLPAAAASPLVA